jgi:exodeoxyribonuclease V beta subunit
MSSVSLAAGAVALLTPNVAPAALDTLRFPLRGSRLIEASAGTGKTFTIAALYVRLVLGHGGAENALRAGADAARNPRRHLHRGGDAGAARPHPPPSRAKRRPVFVSMPAIGSRVGRQRRGPRTCCTRCAQQYPPEQWPACARKLQLAAEAMDEAAVSTIHSLVQPHAARTRFRQRQPVHPDPGDRPA